MQKIFALNILQVRIKSASRKFQLFSIITILDNLKLLSFGSIRFVYQVTDNIVVKYVFANNNKSIYNKYCIYNIFDSIFYCSNLVRSFYRILFANFLQYLSDSTIDQQFRQYQIRDLSNNRVIRITKSKLKSLIWR